MYLVAVERSYRMNVRKSESMFVTTGFLLSHSEENDHLITSVSLPFSYKHSLNARPRVQKTFESEDQDQIFISFYN